MKEEDQFVDPESSFGARQEFGYKQIVLFHLTRITRLACVEWRPGYWEEKIIPLGKSGITTTTKVYHQDTMEVYSNSIDCFHDLLHCKFDGQMNQESEKSNKLKYKNTNEKVEIKRKLFRALCDFMNRMNWLEIKEFED